MITFSKIVLIGYLTAASKFKFVRGDRPVAELTLAVNDSFRRGEEWIDTVSYVDVTCFGALATAVQGVDKGTAIYCEGRLSSSTWTDKKSGQRRFRLKVIAERMRKVPSNKERKSDEEIIESNEANANAEVTQ